jgi:hypothetical protein
VKLEDGLVRIEFQFEKPPVAISTISDNFFKQYPPGVRGSEQQKEKFGGIGGSTTLTSYNVNGMMRNVDWSKNGEVTMQAASASVDKYCADNGIINKMESHDGMATMDSYVPKNDVGITVPGSKSTQKFQTTYMNALEPEKHTIVLKLLGETEDNKPVLKPVTTKHKPKCVTCGKQNKATAKFCTECGTALEIFA